MTLAADVVKKRTKRHLDELEVSRGIACSIMKLSSSLYCQRSNYAEPSASLAGIDVDNDEDGAGGKSARGRARETISDKRTPVFGEKKKKSSMKVRTAVLYRKNFTTLLDESVSGSNPAFLLLTCC